MNENDLQNIPHDDYKRLIAEAYPSPKKDIHAAVMAQIASETEQSRKPSKILTPKRRNLLIRYGSIAACFVLLATLGIRILPMMMKDAVLESAADMEAAEMATITSNTVSAGETNTENHENTKSAAVPYAAKLIEHDVLTAEAEEKIAEEPAAAAAFTALADEAIDEAVPEADDTAPETPMLMMAPTPVTEEAVIEEAVEECIVEECVAEEIVVEETPEYYLNAPDEVESARRMFEYELKLALSQELSGQFGYDSYADWMTERSYTDVSSWSIAEFVDRFHISRERFTELYDAQTSLFAKNHPDCTTPTYDLDKLYSMDDEITASITAGNAGYVTDALYRH